MENKVTNQKSSKLKVLLLGILILAVVGVGAFFGYNKFIKSSSTKKNAVNTVQQVNTQQTSTQGQTTSSLQQVVSSQTFQLSGADGLTVNLADTNGDRYLKVSVYLGYDEKKLKDELTEKQPILTDAVIGILRTKKAADITPKNMDSIKVEILQKLNPMLQKGQLNNVYFTDLIVQ